MNIREVKPGDLIAVPLQNLGCVVGLVLHVSRYFKNGMLVGFYDVLFPNIEHINTAELSRNFVETPNYTSVQIVKKGYWKIIGNYPDLLEQAEIPKLRVVNELYVKDEPIGRLSPEEEKLYPAFAGQGQIYLENKLMDHFFKQNKTKA